MPYLPSLPEKATLLDVFQRFPASSRPLLLYHEALMRGPSPFTEGERELIAAVVSRRNRCGYCEGVHAATARAMGEAPARVAAVLEDPVGARESAELRPVLVYAEKLTRDPAGITQADAEAVSAATVLTDWASASRRVIWPACSPPKLPGDQPSICIGRSMTRSLGERPCSSAAR